VHARRVDGGHCSRAAARSRGRPAVLSFSLLAGRRCPQADEGHAELVHQCVRRGIECGIPATMALATASYPDMPGSGLGPPPPGGPPSPPPAAGGGFCGAPRTRGGGGVGWRRGGAGGPALGGRPPQPGAGHVRITIRRRSCGGGYSALDTRRTHALAPRAPHPPRGHLLPISGEKDRTAGLPRLRAAARLQWPPSTRLACTLLAGFRTFRGFHAPIPTR
jgi:hypothetical protein